MRLKLIIVLAGLMLANTVSATPFFINGLVIPGNTGDLNGTNVNAGRAGFFSDIYYDPNRNNWWVLSDREPGGGTLDYNIRVQRFTLDINSSSGAISNLM